MVVLMAVITGTGFTATKTVKTSPAQLAAVGVTRYVAVTDAAEVLNNCPVILFTPEACAAPPVNPLPVGACQV